jgi:ferrous iron transport protein B
VLVYLPQILLLFTFLSFLEDSGYMARAAFIMDKLLRGFGLSGKSFVPMLMGFGCTVPAVMAARTLENERDRRMTIILTPFMSCGARMPVYAVFAGAFFAAHKGLVVISLYCLGIAVALISGIILKSTVLKGEAETFIMELPNYRLPTLKTIALHVWEKAKEFVVKAFTILLLASVVIWFLQSFDLSLTYVTDNSHSIFASIGKLLVPLFKPCGFGEWRASVALLTGFVAKEAVVSTLGILYGVGESASSSAISGVLAGHFTPLSAYSYLVFVLLYMPCVVAFTTIRKEMNSAKWTLFAVCYQTVAAWIVSFLVYNIGSLFI